MTAGASPCASWMSLRGCRRTPASTRGSRARRKTCCPGLWASQVDNRTSAAPAGSPPWGRAVGFATEGS
eukprot:1947561-Alexandrium_andersonii.AAC.1